MLKIKVVKNASPKTIICEETRTVASVLQEAGADYSRTTPYLNGTPLSAAEVCKTFAEIGITEEATLSCIVKADNAVDIQVAGDAIVFTSAVKLDDIRKLQKYDPASLRVVDEETKEEVFVVCIADSTPCKFAFPFNGETHDDKKLATLTCRVPDHVKTADEIKEYIVDTFGAAITNLKKVEVGIPNAIEAVNDARKDIMDGIDLQ